MSIFRIRYSIKKQLNLQRECLISWFGQRLPEIQAFQIDLFSLVFTKHKEGSGPLTAGSSPLEASTVSQTLSDTQMCDVYVVFKNIVNENIIYCIYFRFQFFNEQKNINDQQDGLLFGHKTFRFFWACDSKHNKVNLDDLQI